MKRFARRTALVALVWLTAASTLFAGLPHFNCLCPSGERKSRCLGVTTKDTGCCCGGSCCAARAENGPSAVPVQAEGGSCCCCRHEGQGTRRDNPERTGEEPTNGGRREAQPVGETAGVVLQLTPARCVRTVAHSDDAALALSGKTGAKGSPALDPFALPTAHPALASSFPTAPGRDSWRLAHAPPPTDLVITLLHLVI